MKVKATREPKKFEPVKLEVTFESLYEASAFFAVFNWSSLCEIVRSRGVDPDAIRDEIAKVCPEAEGYINYNPILKELIALKG